MLVATDVWGREIYWFDEGGAARYEARYNGVTEITIRRVATLERALDILSAMQPEWYVPPEPEG